MILRAGYEPAAGYLPTYASESHALEFLIGCQNVWNNEKCRTTKGWGPTSKLMKCSINGDILRNVLGTHLLK